MDSKKEETLNLDYNICQLIIKVLNKTETKVAAANVLGIGTKNLNAWIKKYNLVSKKWHIADGKNKSS